MKWNKETHSTTNILVVLWWFLLVSTTIWTAVYIRPLCVGFLCTMMEIRRFLRIASTYRKSTFSSNSVVSITEWTSEVTFSKKFFLTRCQSTKASPTYRKPNQSLNTSMLLLIYLFKQAMHILVSAGDKREHNGKPLLENKCHIRLEISDFIKTSNNYEFFI